MKGGRRGLEHADTGCGTHSLAQCSHMLTVPASESPHRGCQLVLAPKTERWEEQAGMPLTSWVTLEHAEPHVCHLPMEALSNPVSQPGVR